MSSPVLYAEYNSSYPEAADGYAMFNRIINIRFLCGKTDKMGVPLSKDPYSGAITLRSDYEAVSVSDKNTGAAEFARCPQKPSILIEGSVHKGGVIPTVTVTLDNFIPVSSGASITSFSADKFPFQELEIHVGYIEQFYNWEKNERNFSYEQYLSFYGDSSSVTVIRASVIAVYQSSQNPDGQLVIECVPAEAKSSLPRLSEINPMYTTLMKSEAVDRMYKAVMCYKDVYSLDSCSQKDFLGVSLSAPTFAEQLFYFLVSRRYYEDFGAKTKGFAAGAFADWQSLYTSLAEDGGYISTEGYKAIKDKMDSGSLSFDSVAWIPESCASYMQKVFVGVGVLRYELPPELFLLVKEYCSSGADTASIETEIKAVLAQYITLSAPTADAMLELIAARIFPTMSWRTVYTPFQKAAPTVSEMKASSGSRAHQALYVYEGDDLYDASSGSVINQALSVDVYSELTQKTLKNAAVMLPCVNSITYGAITKAVIPWQGIFPLMYPLSFPSSFAMSDFVAYYTSDITTAQYFTCFMFEFSFATVDDKNECTLSLTPVSEVYKE